MNNQIHYTVEMCDINWVSLIIFRPRRNPIMVKRLQKSMGLQIDDSDENYKHMAVRQKFIPSKF